VAARHMQRLNDQIRDELAQLLAHETRDPRISGVISITSVETARDLSVAHVYVSVLGTEEEAREVVKNIRRAASFFRRELAARMNLRHTPELDFLVDLSIAEGARIEQLLKEVVVKEEDGA
jgi:ribosome-binding factor A